MPLNLSYFNSSKEYQTSSTHVADGLPLPLRIATKIWVRFLESLYPCEHEMSIKKLFYHPVSELPAKSYSQFGPSRLDWPYCLAGNSETGWWKIFLMLVLCSYGCRHSKKCTLIFVAIRKGRGSPSATCAKSEEVGNSTNQKELLNFYTTYTTHWMNTCPVSLILEGL